LPPTSAGSESTKTNTSHEVNYPWKP
jgi:hypothetical protein